MELEIRLMKWKWMLFSEALKSIFLSSCLAFFPISRFTAWWKLRQEISREEAKTKFIRSIASRHGVLAEQQISTMTPHVGGIGSIKVYNETRFVTGDDVLTHNKSSFLIYNFIRTAFSPSFPRETSHKLPSFFLPYRSIKIACTITVHDANLVRSDDPFTLASRPPCLHFDNRIMIFYCYFSAGVGRRKTGEKAPYNGIIKGA